MSKEINNDGYRLAHTMIRVKDLEASFNFYCKTLGMKILIALSVGEGYRLLKLVEPENNFKRYACFRSITKYRPEFFAAR